MLQAALSSLHHVREATDCAGVFMRCAGRKVRLDEFALLRHHVAVAGLCSPRPHIYASVPVIFPIGRTNRMQRTRILLLEKVVFGCVHFGSARR